MKARNSLKGSYALVIRLERDERLAVGRLGTFDFPAGCYLYCGSALNGLAGRVRRHLRRDKKRHWHVDYLTAAAGVCQVWWCGDGERRECGWALAALAGGATAPAPGFGASDCRCPTHLLYLTEAAGLNGGNAGLERLRRELLGGLPATAPRGWFDSGDESGAALAGFTAPAADLSFPRL